MGKVYRFLIVFLPDGSAEPINFVQILFEGH